jgi:hypothetical protein
MIPCYALRCLAMPCDALALVWAKNPGSQAVWVIFPQVKIEIAKQAVSFYAFGGLFFLTICKLWPAIAKIVDTAMTLGAFIAYAPQLI